MRSGIMETGIDIANLLAAQLAVFLGLLLLGSAFHKVFGFERARSVMQGFAGIPARLAPMAVVLVAVAELLAGLLLCSASYRGVGASIAVLAWSAYLAVILRRIAQGRSDLDCGCSFGAAHSSLGAFQVVRNAVLIGLALIVGLAGAPREIGPGLQPVQLLPALALLALYAALDQIMTLKRLHRGAAR